MSVGVEKVGDFKKIADADATTFVVQTVLGSNTVAMVTYGGNEHLVGKRNNPCSS